MTASSIQKTVMRRVRIIYALRLAGSPFVLAPTLFVLSLWGVGREVWVAHVLQNLSMVHTPEGLAAFAFSAFFNTRAIVQVLTLGVACAMVWFAYGLQEVIAGKRGTLLFG